MTNSLAIDDLLERAVGHLENLQTLGIHELGPTPLEKIRLELGDCTRCKLHKSRKNIVFGVGNPHAKLMFIGEGPGADEDEQGEPFVGRAGQLLTKIIQAIGMTREEVYIANTVKCRPPNNRNPEPDELQACEPFWRKQVRAISPRVIVTLGNIATQTLLRTPDGIGKLRGRFHDFEGALLMPTYHPAFLLRSPDMKRFTWEDMKMVRDHLQEIKG